MDGWMDAFTSLPSYVRTQGRMRPGMHAYMYAPSAHVHPGRVYVCEQACMDVHVHVPVDACMHAGRHVRVLFVRVPVCLSIFTFVCSLVCMFVSLCVQTQTLLPDRGVGLRPE